MYISRIICKHTSIGKKKEYQKKIAIERKEQRKNSCEKYTSHMYHIHTVAALGDSFAIAVDALHL